MYLRFCHYMGYTPVPVYPAHLLQYAAFLARSLRPASIRCYLNIIGLLNNWQLKSLLTGIKRAIGTPPNQKLPITPVILLRLHAMLDFTKSFDSSFWALCLVGFHGMFRKSHLLPMSTTKFDPSKQLTKADFQSFSVGAHSSPYIGAKPFNSENGWLKFLYPAFLVVTLCPTTVIVHAFSFVF